ncbi:hypothetical protein [Amycolatopsis sp. YIM 10]|uniref:hypothetical protein n=1 Tax=Amycolatopsis sp. YIM 10 TaxID=2653857 RepID=UPI0012907D4B|nr:hypothetical protein [Amycolatopsis sp. YIM 10]QFU87843.1 hypothetical protein YIM_13285 [Amycolatopsis sp. YIM 10]QFU94844.1 hypothetical protein YIM_48595 [Amycolatopsis sp. YIM 10]
MNIAFQVGLAKILRDFFNACYDQIRVDADKQLGRGDRLVARSPRNNMKLATVSKQDPAPTVEVVDEPAFQAWVAEAYPEALKTTHEIGGSVREVVDVLFTHAPHLLRETTSVDKEFLRELRTRSAAVGAPVGPGAETDIPGVAVIEKASHVSALAAPGALAEVIELFRTGELSLETLAPRELPGGAA